MVKILSCDPGEQSFAYSVTEIKNKKLIIHETSMLRNTVVNLTSDSRVLVKKRGKDPSLTDGYRAFKKEMMSIHRRHHPTHFVTERFQTRGIKGRSAETVSMMNAMGIVYAHEKKATYRLLMAAQWKNWINKIVPLDELYALGKVCGLTNHTVDTIGIALYEYVNFFKMELNLTPKKLKSLIKNAKQQFKVRPK